MSSKKQSERLEKLEAEEAALDQRISRLETQIQEHQEQGRLAYRQKNIRKAKQEARFLTVLNKQLDQLSAMKINIFECLQSEAMRGFVTNYAEAIKPVHEGGLSIEKAEANINGTMDFMEKIGELTDVVTEEMGTSDTVCFQSELDALFGGDDPQGGSKVSDQAKVASGESNIDLPNVPATMPVPPKQQTPKPPPSQPESVAKLESTLNLVRL